MIRTRNCRHGVLPEECGYCAPPRMPEEPPEPPPAREPRSSAEHVLAAARSIGRPFTDAELVMASWRAAPWLFGLNGFKEYPDARKVAVCLYGVRGLIARGLLQRAPGGLIQAA